MKRLYKIVLLGMMYSMPLISLISCKEIINSNPVYKGPRLFINNVSGANQLITKELVLTANNFVDSASVPIVSWENHDAAPHRWLVLMYKRGSNDIYWMSLVNGAETLKAAGADYANTRPFDSNANFPVEYRITLTRIEGGTWSIDPRSVTMNVRDSSLENELQLTAQDIITISRLGEEDYIIRTEEGLPSRLDITNNVKLLSDAKLIGITVGRPVIKFPSDFPIISQETQLENGDILSTDSTEKGFKHVAGKCVGFRGISGSPELSWNTRNSAAGRSFVMLAYDPVQENPIKGFEDINNRMPALYFSLWFQYNIPWDLPNKKLPEYIASSADVTLNVRDISNLPQRYGQLTQNIYSQAKNPLNEVYNDCNSEDPSVFPTRVRYDGPIPYPYSARHYIRFMVFEIAASTIDVFRGRSAEDMRVNKTLSLNRRKLKEGEASGAVVDEVVMNFIDLDRRLRRNDFGSEANPLVIEYWDQNALARRTATVLGVGLFVVGIDAPPSF